MMHHSNHEKSAQSLYSHRIERIFVFAEINYRGR
jgi:hypothetical protein